MISGNRSTGYKLPKVVLVRSIVSMPSNDVKRRMMDLILKEFSTILINDSPFFLNIFIVSYRNFKIMGICTTV